MRQQIALAWTTAILVMLFVADNQSWAQQSTSWVVLSAPVSSQSGYRLRLLTESEKNQSQKTVDEYKKLEDRSSEEAQGKVKAYRDLPSDLRTGRYCQVVQFEPDRVELKHDDFHVILPMTSVEIVFKGLRGSIISLRSARPSPESFLRALRGGDRSSGASRPGASRAPSRPGSGDSSRRGAAGSADRPAGGLAGALSGSLSGGGFSGGRQAAAREEKEKEAIEISIFYLQFAQARNAAEVIELVLADSPNLRIAVDQRTNAIIVRADQKTLKQIEALLKSLDRKEAFKPDTNQQSKPAPTKLSTYPLKQADSTTVLRVLQTLMAGEPDLRLDVDPATNQIIALARESQHKVIKDLIEKLDGGN